MKKNTLSTLLFFICLVLSLNIGAQNPPCGFTHSENGDTAFFSGFGGGPFSWAFGDGNTSTLQNPTHVYSSLGKYNACMTDSDLTWGCYICDTVTISLPNGIILSNNQSVLLDVSPNPFSTSASISYYIPTGEKGQIYVYDILGNKVVEYMDIPYTAEVNNFKFDTPISPGVYFMQLSTKSSTVVRKIISN